MIHINQLLIWLHLQIIAYLVLSAILMPFPVIQVYMSSSAISKIIECRETGLEVTLPDGYVEVVYFIIYFSTNNRSTYAHQ